VGGVVTKPPQNPDAAESGKPSPDEVDDQFRAILEGLRTSIPGVMVLFSFLLILPLQTSFGDISNPNTVVFYVAFTSAAISAVLLIAPSVHQRVRAPISGIRRRSWSHVMYATKVAIAGTVFFLIAIAAVVYLVSSLVFSDPFAVAATLVIGVIATWSWFYLPLVRFNRDEE
jgi:Na+-transporting methylmalonyl-CoA/oxaloacetate decarboxylase gamma subunit